MELHTDRLNVVLQTRREVERMIEAMSEWEKANISADWLALVRTSEGADPWVHGFRVVHRDSGTSVGSCGFKGPPIDGVVEIAYGIQPEHQRQGYATEVAQALVDYAFSREEVRIVRAHTLPNAVASIRVLKKCGFRFVGETIDPDDGTVCRFEWVAADVPGAHNKQVQRTVARRRFTRQRAAAERGVRVTIEMSRVFENLRTLEKLAELFNAHDLDRIMEFFTEDCSLDMPRGSAPWGTRYVGKSAVREGLRTRFEMLPDVYYGDVRHFATEDMGVSEWLVTGTLRSGVAVKARGCDHYEFRDGKVVRKDSYWKIVE